MPCLTGHFYYNILDNEAKRPYGFAVFVRSLIILR